MVCRGVLHHRLRMFSCLLISHIILTKRQISSPSPAEIADRNGGNYDAVPYKYFGYPKVAKNMLETANPNGIVPSQANPIAERILQPRYLCFLRDGRPAKITKVDEW